MKLARLIWQELKQLSTVLLFFLIWLGLGALLQTIVLTEYSIGFDNFIKVIVFTVVIAKATLVLNRLPFNRTFHGRLLYLDVVYRSLIYTLGAMILIVVEALGHYYFQDKHISLAIATLWQSSEFYRLLAIAIWIFTAFIFYNIFSAISLFLGEGTLLQLFLRSKRSQLTSKQD